MRLSSLVLLGSSEKDLFCFEWASAKPKHGILELDGMLDKTYTHARALSANLVFRVIFSIQNISQLLPFQEFMLLYHKAACHHTSGVCLHRNIAQMCIIIFIQNVSEKDNSYRDYDNSLN